MSIYQAVTAKLRQENFHRVEKDDRLLDILPGESREKGIELWEKWRGDQVYIVRIHVDKLRENPVQYCLPKQDVIASLQSNQFLSLGTYPSTC